MPKRTDIKKIMVIGSGPIIIGQAAEFDYAGTQACLALKEEGYNVVLVNSNPATIMTDKEIADKVYIEPLTTEFVTRILRKERPDALLPTLGLVLTWRWNCQKLVFLMNLVLSCWEQNYQLLNEQKTAISSNS